jgi:hypothetical protein
LGVGEYSLSPSLLRPSFKAPSIILAQEWLEWNEIALHPECTQAAPPGAALRESSYWS